MQQELDTDSASSASLKKFKNYEPGFVHIDVKYLPQMQDEPSRSYFFVAIHCATRWVYLEIRKDKSARSAKAFLNKGVTNNGKEFTNRFTGKGERKPTGPPFDRQSRKANIKHRLIRPRRPQTNSIVERFNRLPACSYAQAGRSAEILHAKRFHSSADLKHALKNYQWAYDYRILQTGAGKPSAPCRHQTMAARMTRYVLETCQSAPGS